MNNTLRTLLAIAGTTAMAGVLCFTPAAAHAEREKWVAPKEASAVKNPQPSSEDSLAQGKEIYGRRCENCHGDTGHGDGEKAKELSVDPARFDGDAQKKESDGALFWKIRTGRKPMPKYGTRLTEDETWDVVNYVRSLGKK